MGTYAAPDCTSTLSTFQVHRLPFGPYCDEVTVSEALAAHYVSLGTTI